MLIVHVTNTDPAGSVYNFVRAVNTHTEHRARMITTQVIPAFDFPKDVHDLFDGGDEIEALLTQADVIHFHKVKDDFTIDLPLQNGIRRFALDDFLARKKVVYHIHGAPSERNFVERTSAEYAALLKSHPGRVVLASTPDLEAMYQPALGSGMRYFPNCVPINDVRYLPRATDAPIMGADGVTRRYCVFQSGTHSILKNMHVIRDVMDRVSKDLPVFFLHTSPDERVVDGRVTGGIQTQDMALRHKRIAHIVFDHIEGYYGLSSLESLSMGKPTIAGISEVTSEAICKFFGIMATQLPWIIARDEATIEARIRSIITDEGLRRMIGDSSRRFMQEVWSDAHIARRMASLYESL